ncbi:Cyclic nucleotide-binding domain (CNMP-BD) protein (modular protein) [Rhodospirillaceae bacterium LM-1]|nr:Cyclic nucleotide-binding domain (CNMP-BD) protein (modular protein) [Rhodospirillaceae bacterium LM-1]
MIELPDLPSDKTAAGFDIRRLKMDDFVFQEGDPADEAFIIESGLVEILAKGESGEFVRLNSLGKGELFGELALLDGMPRSATVRVVEDVQLIVVPRRKFDAQIMQLSPLLRKVMTIVGQRVRRLSCEISRYERL